MDSKNTLRAILKELRLLKKEVRRRNLYRKRFLSISEAAIITGVSKSYIQKLIASKQLSHTKPTGKLVFINRKDLQNFLSQNYVPSQDELETTVSNYLIKR